MVFQFVFNTIIYGANKKADQNNVKKIKNNKSEEGSALKTKGDALFRRMFIAPYATADMAYPDHLLVTGLSL